MPDEPHSPTNGAAAPTPGKSLREIAEAAYDEINTSPPAEGAPAEPAAEPADGQITRPRDNLGRFAAAKPGEAAPPAQDGTQPREDQGQQPPPSPSPGPAGSSSEAPANWSAADKEAFAKLQPEGQQFLLRRHSEMEGDYQRRVQANRAAAEFTSALEPIFRDPVIAGSLQANALTPYHAIEQWAGFHRRAMSPNVQDRVQLAFELAARMGLDPAVFAPSRPGGPQGAALSEQDLKDPAIRYFADHIGRTSTEVQELRATLQQMRQADQNRQNAEAVRVNRWSIDTFADEKGADGKPLRPDFDQVLDTIIDLFKANPQRDLREAYETARWMVPTTRNALIAAERSAVEQKAQNQRAAQAVRSNTRGMTSPVSKPAGDGKPKGLRGTIEATADEIGF
jgi:hypothetical protein